MPYPQEKLMAQEHQALRLEMAANRRFIFERPVLIITAGIAGLLGFFGIEKVTPDILIFTTALAIPYLAVLWFNLWFTANRLQSNARIVAYIQLIHEPGVLTGPGSRHAASSPRYPWIGWENALRKWREFERKRTRENPFPPSGSGRSGRSIRSFYHPIFVVHVGAGLFIGALLVCELLYLRLPCGTAEIPILRGFTIAMTTVGFAAVAAYLIVCLGFLRSDARHGIEYHRRGWKRIFDQLLSRPSGSSPSAPPGSAG